MTQKSITSFFKRKVIDQVSNTNNNKRFASDNCIFFDKIQQEIDEQSKMTPILSSNIGHSWFVGLKEEYKKDYFVKLNDFVVKERKDNTIYPPKDEVFTWTKLCQIDEVKVVILGQDPYHGPNQAHGLAFSVKKGVPPPPSLVNIYKEVRNSYPQFNVPKHGDLTNWAKHGVLLLNSCLTVKANNANSHSNKGWEQLTNAVIKHLNSNRTNLVFFLWGSYAQKKGEFIDRKKHLVLKSVHPSPLSAHRGFIGCGHFKSANDYLIKNNLEPIDWTKLD